MTEQDFADSKKAHRKKKGDGKKKEGKAPPVKGNNPKAFTVQNITKTERRVRRKEDLQEKRKHQPLVDRTPLEPPPVVVAIVGPPKVGKSTLLHCLIKNFTKQTLTNIKGPVTVVSSKRQRLTFIECNNDINSMIDIAKVADLVLVMVDASFGFEMEIFEFLNICQVHGFPRIMGVLTHLDTFKNNKALSRTKKNLKHRFWTEVYQGAKLFYLSGMVHSEYQKTEVHNLGRFISVMKFRPLIWRTTHPYLLADRIEDITDPEQVRQNEKCDRLVCMYGYLRGTNLSKKSKIHIPGAGDFAIKDMSFLPDPCPLPEVLKKRSLVEKEKTIYAPMSGVGGIVYDKDAVYIDLGGSHSHKDKKKSREKHDEDEDSDGETEAATQLVSNIISTEATLTEKLEKSQLKLFSSSDAISSQVHAGGKGEVNVGGRRKVVFGDEKEDVVNDDGGEGDSSDDEDGDGDDSDENEEEEDSDDESEDDDNEEDSKNENENEVEMKESESEDEEITFPQKSGKVEKRKQAVQQEGKHQVAKKQKTVGDINAAILKEIGGGDSDESDGDSDEEEQVEEEEEMEQDEDEKSARSEVDKSATFEGEKVERHKSSEKKIRPEDRLVTEKDTQTLSKVKQALINIQNKVNDKSLEDNEEEDESDDDSEAGSDEDDKDSDDSDDEDGDETLMEDEADPRSENKKEESDEDDDEEESTLKWKDDLATKARDAFYSRQSSTASLRKLVYGHLQNLEEEKEDESGSDEDGELGGLFKVVSQDQAVKSQTSRVADRDDCSLFQVENLHDWEVQDICDKIKDCFVTGKWKESEDAEELLNLDNEDEEDLYDDFEDLETGVKVKGKDTKGEGSDDEEEDKPRVVDYGGDAEREKEKRKARMERKLALKKQFDTDYDDGEGAANSTYYDDLKKEVDDQSNLNKKEFESMDDSQRVLYEGYRPGMYVRIEMEDLPCELIKYFDPSTPLILGGLLKGEEQIGYVQTRLKKHRWFPKILKNRDPFIVSLGWRRFQTLPIYSICDHNMRRRMLKYTPEHLHCDAYFWGPITPQGSGMLAVQSLEERQENFRIVATGVVLEMDQSSQVMKKLKLTGEPYKIFKKTAFIKGMFNSSLEVAKFEKAQIRTVSGVRGIIKKALHEPEGAFRASFEDKILLSDIVFVKTWYKVEVPKFCAPVTNLLMSEETRESWRGMRTTAQIKRDKNIRNEANQDSLYRPVNREEKVFQPLKIPKALQETLPYHLKPKKSDVKIDPTEGRVAVVLDHKERKIENAFKMLRALHSDKVNKQESEKKKRMREYSKLKKAEEFRKMKKQKEARKQISRMMTQKRIAAEKKRAKSGGKRSAD